MGHQVDMACETQVDQAYSRREAFFSDYLFFKSVE